MKIAKIQADGRINQNAALVLLALQKVGSFAQEEDVWTVVIVMIAGNTLVNLKEKMTGNAWIKRARHGIVTTTTGMEVVMENTKVGFPKIAEKLVVFAKTRKNDWA